MSQFIFCSINVYNMNGKVLGEQVEKNISKRLISLKKKRKNHLSLSARWVSVYCYLLLSYVEAILTGRRLFFLLLEYRYVCLYTYVYARTYVHTNIRIYVSTHVRSYVTIHISIQIRHTFRYKFRYEFRSKNDTKNDTKKGTKTIRKTIQILCSA